MALPLLLAIVQGLELVSAHRVGDPIALAVDERGSRVFVAEGASVAELELAAGGLVERRRFALDAPAAELVLHGERLLVAGATRGAGVVELGADAPEVRWFDAPAGATCTALAADEARCVAVFATREGSELRTYAPGTLARTGSTRLPGLALDVALAPGHAYVALGPAGVARLALGSAPELGPELARAAPAPNRVSGPVWARDLALAAGRLYVAADDAGLIEIEIELEGEWRSARARAVPLAVGGKPGYAIRVAAEGARVVVGTTRGPARACDGAPYGLFGTIGWNLDVGAVDPRGFEIGASEAWWLFERRADELALCRSEEIEHSGWRSLALRGTRVFEQHLRIGTLVRELARDSQGAWSARTLATRRPPGLPAIDGRPSLIDPRLVLFGIDSAGSLGRGLLRIDERHGLSPARGLEDVAPLGLGVGAQWLDAEPTREWFVSNGLLAWRLQRLSHGGAPKLESWDLPPPEPPDAGRGGVRGNSYLNSTLSGSLVLVTRYGSRFGLLAYEREALTAAAQRAPPGSRLQLAPAWQVETHASDEAAPCHTWNACVFDLPDRRRVVAVAAGANTRATGEHFERPQVVLFDLARGAEAPPERLAWLHGAGARGLAVALSSCTLAGRVKLAVATTGGELCLFDVTEPERARLERTWLAPRHGYDGLRDGLLDLELWPSAAGARAFVAAGRSGLLAVELSGAAPELERVDDTPGWAAGLATTLLDGRRHLLLGDQRAGLRLYR